MRLASLPLGRAVPVLFLLCVSSASAKTLYVAKSGDSSDGQSWETAYNTITAAVVNAATGDTIHVSAETYVENITLATPVSIIGGFHSLGEAVLPVASKTVVDGNQAGPVFQISNATVAIEELVASNGLASQGGGMYIDSATAFLCGVYVTDCISLDEFLRGSGGGIYVSNGVLSLDGCSVTNCVAGRRPTRINQAVSFGGGICAFSSSFTLTSSVISHNVAHDGFLFGGSASQIIPGRGGGIYLSTFAATIENLVAYGNEASSGGCIHSDVGYVGGERLRMFNSTLVSDRQVLGWLEPSPAVRNCIIVGTDTPVGGTASISFSNVQGGYSGVGNIDADSLFVDPENGDFRLQPSSPCIDSAFTTGPATDLDGNPRPFDVPGVGTDGPGAFDMGAYEFTLLPTPAPTLVNERSDIDGDDRVDAKDLLILLTDWMKTTGP